MESVFNWNYKSWTNYYLLTKLLNFFVFFFPSYRNNLITITRFNHLSLLSAPSGVWLNLNMSVANSERYITPFCTCVRASIPYSGSSCKMIKHLLRGLPIFHRKLSRVGQFFFFLRFLNFLSFSTMFIKRFYSSK